MKEEIRENDIVEVTLPTGGTATARVRWVNEEGNVGITYIAPDEYKGGASVVSIDELEVIQRDMGEELKDVSDADLIAAIARLRSMRLPKRHVVRKVSVSKRTQKSKLDALFEEGGEALEGLIERAVKELREEKGGN